VTKNKDIVRVNFGLGFELEKGLAVDVYFIVEVEVGKGSAFAIADTGFFDSDGDVTVFGEVVEDWSVDGLDISG
jgi:hypothetical protein